MGTSCERCRKMSLPCLFKFTAKPISPTTTIPIRKTVSATKKSRLVHQVFGLHEDAEELEAQLQTVLAAHRQQKVVSSNRNNDWSLSISKSSLGGVRLETSVHAMSDMLGFLQQTWQYFCEGLPPERTPTYYVDRTQQYLKVTYRMTDLEGRIRRLFSQVKTIMPAIDADSMLPDEPAVIEAKRRVIDTHYGCGLYLSPVLVRSYYKDYLKSNPNSMLTNALVAFVVSSQCRHLDIPFERREIAQICQREARSQLQDALFDNVENIPSVETMATLCLLGKVMLTRLKADQARIYLSLAWRMAIQLKDTYLQIVQDIDRKIGIDAMDPVLMAKAESWRRMFYVLRYLETIMNIMYEGNADYSSIIFHGNVGFPAVLPCEEKDPALANAVRIYRCNIQLSILPCGQGESTSRMEAVGYQLVSGVLESVSCADIEFIETRLAEFWRRTPSEYWLSDDPLGYIDLERLKRCTDPHILYLNQMYYMYWVQVESRLMQSPAVADMTTASLARLDAERALLIVSICCDAVSNISAILYQHMPCAVELHWMSILMEFLIRLKDAADPGIRSRAKSNLQSLLYILNSIFEFQAKETRTPSSEGGYDSSSCSSSCSSGSFLDGTESASLSVMPSDYLREFWKQMDLYLGDRSFLQQ